MIVKYEDLRKGIRGASLTATGCRISARGIRRIACASLVIPIVLGGAGQSLDVGRERRTATERQRRVLAARDGGCAHVGCTRPPHWTHAHHIISWADGGHTKIDNLVMLCVVHHRMIHESGWVVRIRDGLPEFIPPRWVDPGSTPLAHRGENRRHTAVEHHDHVACSCAAGLGASGLTFYTGASAWRRMCQR